jgi:hypothetical protein
VFGGLFGLLGCRCGSGPGLGGLESLPAECFLVVEDVFKEVAHCDWVYKREERQLALGKVVKQALFELQREVMGDRPSLCQQNVYR